MTRLTHEILFENAGRAPRNVALVSDGLILTYDELATSVRQLSMLLGDGGLKKGQRVVILLADKKDLIVAIYGVMAAGGVAVPLHEGCALLTVKKAVEDCGARFMIAGSSDLEAMTNIRSQVNTSFILMRNGHGGRHGKHSSYVVSDERFVLEGMGSTPRTIRPSDGAVILFTSGTTGKRRGVYLTHENLFQSSANINEFMGIDSTVVEFVSPPLTHSFGFGRIRSLFLAGGTAVVTNKPLSPTVMSREILENECDALSAVPSTMAGFLGGFEHLLVRFGRQMRFAEFGSEAMPLEHKRRLLAALPHARLCMHYGLTEASRSTFIEFHHEVSKLDTAGKPSPNVELSILDPSGNLGSRGSGEIVVRGRHVAAAYWNDDSLTRERFLSDGWFRTGDFGFMDGDGYLHLLERDDAMITIDGIKISPLEIEEPIRKLFPSVELCVVGYPDPKGAAGEIPVLCYEKDNPGTIVEDELAALLGSRMDKFKIPRLAVPVDALPKTMNRKLKRQELLKLVSRRLSEPGSQIRALR